MDWITNWDLSVLSWIQETFQCAGADRFFSGIDEDKLPPEVKDPEPVEPDRATTIQVNDLFTEN